MKKNILLLALLTVATLPGWGQKRNVMERGRVSVAQESYYLKGDSVYLALTIALDDIEMNRRGFVLLTPEIKNDSMNVSRDLPPVMIEGRNRYKAHKRLEVLNRAPIGVGHVINAGAKDAPRDYPYTAVIPYEPWMRYADFGIREDQCVCNGPITPVEFRLIANGMENRNPVKPGPVKVIELNYAVSFKIPNPEPVKHRSEGGRAFLNFVVDRSELKPDFKDNASELAKIDESIRRVDGDPYTAITQIVIDGYASPEASYAHNMPLSANRARALKEYVRNTYGLKESLLRVNGRGEDWAGLDELVSASDKPYKDAALAIIRGTDIFDGREKKLMNLQGGAPYKEMLAEMFPQLRRSDYELKYTVIPFTVEQGRQIIETNPQLMSLNEMFLVAMSYPEGSAEYHRVLDIAARQFPGSDIANLNAAANALAAKNTADAGRYLDKVAIRDAAWANNMGVMAALQGDLKEAAAHFESAEAAGNPEAVKNLAELEKLKEVR